LDERGTPQQTTAQDARVPHQGGCSHARTAQAPRPRISIAASSRARYHARCTRALAGRGHSHIACQTARAPRPRISIAASSRARYHARCTRALAGHVLTRQNTQSCKCTACSGPQPLTRTARPAKRCTSIQGPGESQVPIGDLAKPAGTRLNQRGPNCGHLLPDHPLPLKARMSRFQGPAPKRCKDQLCCSVNKHC
jgi:hypothetical protein